MPTEKKKPQGDFGDGPKIVALVLVALLVVGCVWVFNSLRGTNDQINCIASGRTNCDQLDR